MAIFIIMVIVAEPQIMFFVLFLCYIVSGPLGYLLRLAGRRRREA
jgi:CDP-diacylglycerol--serine O-phosphatidyltransferase